MNLKNCKFYLRHHELTLNTLLGVDEGFSSFEIYDSGEGNAAKSILVISLKNLYDEKTIEVKMYSTPDNKVSYVPETGNSGTILIRRD